MQLLVRALSTQKARSRALLADRHQAENSYFFGFLLLSPELYAKTLEAKIRLSIQFTNQKAKGREERSQGKFLEESRQGRGVLMAIGAR
jgi:hypothetical protein